MIAYWERDCEWMGDGLQLAICPSFTGPTGLAALDVSGKSNHGTLTGMASTAWTTSGGKGALSFDGAVSTRVVVPAVSLGVVHTTTAWLYGRGQALSFNFGGLTGDGVSNTSSLYVGGANSTTLTSFGYTMGASGVGVTVPDFANRWTFLSTVRSGTTVVLYQDGVQLGSGTLPANDSFNMTQYGTRQSSVNFGWFNGFSDDLRVFSRPLTAPEIRQMYERDRGGGMLYQPPSRRSYYAQLAAAFSIVAESGSYALTGQPIPLLYGRSLPADTGSVLLSGQTTSLLTSRLLNADQGSYAYTGTDAATLLGRLLDAGAAVYTLDGNAAGFIASRRISVDTVAYLASGLDVGFLRSRVLEAGTGQYVLVASPVNLQTGTPGTGGAAPYYYLFLLGGSR